MYATKLKLMKANGKVEEKLFFTISSIFITRKELIFTRKTLYFSSNGITKNRERKRRHTYIIKNIEGKLIFLSFSIFLQFLAILRLFVRKMQ